MRISDSLVLSPRDVVAIVGGGGKTTVMYRLARETAEDGGFAVATGTTLFTPPPAHERPRIVVEQARDALLAAVAWDAPPGRWLIATAGHGTKGRLLPVEPDVPAALAAVTGVRLVVAEADGSRNRSFKAPGDHEPVIPDAATLVVAVAGMTALGRPLDDEHVHRPECVAALTGAALSSPVTLEIMATVLAHPEGGRKSVPAGCRYAVILNQVDAAPLDDARRLARMLRDRGVPLVLLAHAREPDPVVEAVGGLQASRDR